MDLGRPGRGVALFALFAFCLNGIFMAPLLLGSREVRVACALGAAGVWIVALVDAVRLAGAAATRPAPEAPPDSAPAPDKKVEKPVA